MLLLPGNARMLLPRPIALSTVKLLIDTWPAFCVTVRNWISAFTMNTSSFAAGTMPPDQNAKSLQLPDAPSHERFAASALADTSNGAPATIAASTALAFDFETR